MTITELNIGDTNYIPAINANFSAISSAIATLQSLLTGSNGGAASNGLFFSALFNTNKPIKMGVASYQYSVSGTVFSITAGTVWKPSLGQLVSCNTNQTLDFTGRAAATLYVTVDATGLPMIASSDSDSLYSVVWNGSSFGTITPLANTFLTAAEEDQSLVSSKYGAFNTLNARLANIESKLA